MVSAEELARAAAFRASIRRFARRTEAVTSSFRLTSQRYDLLLFVHSAPGNRTTTTDLAERLQLGQPSVTELVKRAESAGLLQRTRDSLDRRRVWIELSPAGREVMLNVFRGLQDAREELARSIGEADRRLRESH